MSKLRLQGKVAIITGAASGIGEAAARLFSEHGATVIIADIQDALGLTVAASIDNCVYKHCDVTKEHDVRSTVDFAVSTYGRLDIMYSNAGVMGPFSSIFEIEAKDLEDVLMVNVVGATLAIKHAARVMGKGGAIVCTASISGHMAVVGPTAYTVSKHAVLGLVRAAAGELGGRGIRVNCVSPFGVATPLSCGFVGVTPEIVEGNMEKLANLKGVVLKARHVAEAAMFLASEEAAYVSGHDLFLDGGSSVVYAGNQRN